MRIVHYYPTARVGSGVTIALWSWARALAHAGVPVAVLHAGDRPRNKHVLDDPAGDSGLIEEHIAPHRGRGRTTTFPVGLHRYLRRCTSSCCMRGGRLATKSRPMRRGEHASHT